MKPQNHEEYLKLIEEIQKHDELYYSHCKPIISDYAYDQLSKDLVEYEKEHPEEIVSYSPTQRVGENVSKGFIQKEHIKPMLSLANTYNEKEIQDFIDRVYKLLGHQEVSFCVELKMDGTAVSVRYEKGNLVRALTRGDGTKGDDVTQNIKTIKSLPLKLKGPVPELLEVRGEVYMDKKTFQELNTQREEEGLELWANPRNAAAGSLKLLDPKEVANRHLNIILYGIAESDEFPSSQYEIHEYLHKLGLPTAAKKHLAKCKNLIEIMEFTKTIQKIRDGLPFEIDGIVIKVDSVEFYEKLGMTGKSPRYAVAYKFAPEQAETIIEAITVQVGRTGVLTPVAELKPTFLAGSLISRATLHNEDEIKRKDIRVSDHVIIEKGGDVIPKVVEVNMSKRLPQSSAWHMPKACPICQTEVIHKEGEVAVRCPNPHCPGKKLQKMIFFVSKQALDIEHLGEKVVEKLIQMNLIQRPSDIFRLTQQDLEKVEGFKEKSVHNLLQSIERAKKCTLARFIMALEIPYVGKQTAEDLANIAQDIHTLVHFTREDLLKIEGIGDKMADSIVSYFQKKENLEEIQLLLQNGLEPQKPHKILTDHLFSGKVFVLTGSLIKFSRDEASRLIKERGGKTSSSVSSQTDYVLLGENPGSKYDKAKELNIKILSEDDFEKML
jgi:DNA ligase (NAD+)